MQQPNVPMISIHVQTSCLLQKKKASSDDEAFS
jgi:hypothetical protein